MRYQNTLAYLVKTHEYLKNAIVTQVNKAWSHQAKYLLKTKSDAYLLSLFDKKYYLNEVEKVNVLNQLTEFKLPVPRPIEHGVHNDLGYVITTYIEGIDGQEALDILDDNTQYQLGIQAGKLLKDMHTVKPLKKLESWYKRKVKKHQYYSHSYKQCENKVSEDILTYISKNIHLMKHRPTRFQHDDYHLGNIIINHNQITGIIDFDLFDYGDPYHDFIKVGFFSSKISHYFAIGQIHGYFNHKEPPVKFFKLYSLYLAMAVISSIVWTEKYHIDKISEMMEDIQKVIKDHDNFTQDIPQWYLPINRLPKHIKV